MKDRSLKCIVFPKSMHRSMRNVDKGLRAVGMLHEIDKMNARPRTEPKDLVEAMKVRLERVTPSSCEVGSKLIKSG